MTMKKLFTLFFAASLSLGSYAADFTDSLVVSINNVAMPAQTSTISVNAQDNGKYSFLLKDFSFSGMSIGDINLTDVEGNTVNGTTYLRTAQTVTVSLYGTTMNLPIILRSEIKSNKLYVDMDIAGVPGMTIHATFAGGGDLGGFQIPNSGFEDYYTYTDHSNIEEPLYWHSFASASGDWASAVNNTKHTEPSTEVRPGSKGKMSLKVTSTSILGFIANGTVTTGRMNAGSMAAGNTANHAQADMSSTDKDGHGDPFYVALNGQPDSLEVWVAFKQAKAKADHPYATVSAITTDGTYYQDPENKDYTNKRAEARYRKLTTTFSGDKLVWKKLSIPFTEDNKAITPKTILVTMSTNADAGAGSDGDVLYIDDLSLIYNAPTVKGISFKGQTITFSSNAATVNASGTVSASDFAVETEGALGAQTSISFNTVNNVVVATVIVTSGDYKSFQIYTVKLPGATATAIHSVATDNNNAPSELFNLAGQRISNAQPGQVVIVKKGGKAVKVVK